MGKKDDELDIRKEGSGRDGELEEQTEGGVALRRESVEGASTKHLEEQL